MLVQKEKQWRTDASDQNSEKASSSHSESESELICCVCPARSLAGEGITKNAASMQHHLTLGDYNRSLAGTNYTSESV